MGSPPESPRRRDQETVLRARALLREDIERVVIHLIPTEKGKPFARAEVLTTAKGLLRRVAFVVAGAGFAECYTSPAAFWIDHIP
jgi:hypothetical protein